MFNFITYAKLQLHLPGRREMTINALELITNYNLSVQIKFYIIFLFRTIEPNPTHLLIQEIFIAKKGKQFKPHISY